MEQFITKHSKVFITIGVVASIYIIVSVVIRMVV